MSEDYTMKNTASSINADGETGHAKESAGLCSQNVYKTKLKMDKRLKCNTWNHKSSREKQRQHTLWQQYLRDITPQARETKVKINWTIST